MINKPYFPCAQGKLNRKPSFLASHGSPDLTCLPSFQHLSNKAARPWHCRAFGLFTTAMNDPFFLGDRYDTHTRIGLERARLNSVLLPWRIPTSVILVAGRTLMKLRHPSVEGAKMKVIISGPGPRTRISSWPPSAGHPKEMRAWA